MRYIIFSDVQGNFRALERFFADTGSFAGRYLCLGDIVNDGKSYDDNLCIELVKSKGCLVVRGNHEKRLLENDLSWKKISQPNLEYVASLPLELTFDNHFLVHAPLGQRILTAEQAKDAFQELPSFIEICFFGHSHKPAIFCRNRKGKIEEKRLNQNNTFLRPDSEYMINPGGIGLYWNLPQTYMIFDDSLRSLEFRRMFN